MITMSTLIQKIQKEIYPKLKSTFGIENINAVPKIQKIVINVGIRSDLKDAKAVENIVEDLKLITGQAPVKTLAKKSIASFKTREGQVVGLMVTLRGTRMNQFLDKLFNVTLARVRDFRGLPGNAFDASGNYSIGLKDQLAFPEILPDNVKQVFGMQVTIVTRANTPEQAKEFLKLIGLPIKKEDNG
nr:ribosomal protein L5 [uncultured bacterium]